MHSHPTKSGASSSSNGTEETEALGDIDYERLLRLNPSDFYAGTRFDPRNILGVLQNNPLDLGEEEEEEEEEEEDGGDEGDDLNMAVDDSDDEEKKKYGSYYQRRLSKIVKSVKAGWKAGKHPELRRDYSLEDLGTEKALHLDRITATTAFNGEMSVRKEDGNDEGMNYKEDDTLVNNPRDFFYAMVDKVCQIRTTNSAVKELKMEAIRLFSNSFKSSGSQAEKSNCTQPLGPTDRDAGSTPIGNHASSVTATPLKTPKLSELPECSLCLSFNTPRPNNSTGS